MHTDSESDDTLIRYLRGELAEAERDRIEGLYFADDKLHDRLAMLEERMIDSYVRGRLPADERERFRRRAQTSSSQRRKMEFAEALRRAAEQKVGSPERRSWLDAFQGFLRVQAPARQMALAAAVMVAIGGSLLCLQYAKRPHIPVQRAVAPPPQLAPKSPPPDTAPQRAAPILAFALSPLERSGGEENRVVIPAGTYTVRLRLELEDGGTEGLIATLRTAEGAAVDQVEGLRPQSIGPGRRAVFVSVPSSRLRDGQYVVRVSHAAADGTTELVAGFSFRVEHAR